MKKYYLLFLIGYLILYEFFDSYSTSYYSAVVSYIQADFQITSSTWYYVIGFASAGMILAWFIQFLADIIGRKPVLIFVFFGMGLASVLMYFSRTIGQFGVGFFLLWVCFSSDIWIIVLSEESPEAKRARHASLIAVVGAFGALAVPAARSLFIHATPSEDPSLWRTMTFLAILALPFSILGIGLRETRAFASGRVLLSNPSWTESLRIAGRPFSTATRSVMLAFVVIGAVTGMLLGVYSTIEAFVSEIIADVAVVNRMIVAASLGTLTFFATAGQLADRLGRKVTVCTFVAASFVATLLLVLVVPGLVERGSLSSVYVVVFVCNGAFWGALLISKVHCLECFPTEIRGTASGWRTLSFAVGIVSGSFVAGALAAVLPLGTVYLVFAGLAVAVIPAVVLAFLPETRGVSITGTAP